MPRYQDPETGKFISKKIAESRGIKPLGDGGINFVEAAEDYLKDLAKEEGITEKEALMDLVSKGFMIVEFDEVTGKASLQVFSGEDIVSVSDMDTAKLRKIYKDLRENFPPVSAGIEYHKTFMVGSGFDIIADDPSDKHQIEMRDACKEFSKDVYMDYYRRGLDKILYIMSDDVLTYGASAAEIVYDREIEFDEFADVEDEVVIVNGKQVTKKVWKPTSPFELEPADWKGFGGITRLKIIDNTLDRLTAKLDKKSNEILYWVLDESQATTEQNVQMEIRRRAGMSPNLQEQESGVKFHPFEIFWVSWNTRGTSLMGESIIRPVVDIALLVRKIQKAIGKGFDRWAEKKFFFVCGSERRPWSRNAIRKFLKYMELMIKNHWTGIPVPAGFDVKEIGGTVFEGTNILNHLINMICAGMNYPSDFLEQGKVGVADKAWLAWQVKYGADQRQFRRDIENQLFEKHLWCEFGKTYRVPKQNVKPRRREKKDIYVPKIQWKAEGRFQKAEELKTLQGWLNVANPVGPQMKLAIEKRGSEIMGFGEIPFPTFKELERQIEAETKMQEELLRQKEKRLEGGVSVSKIQEGQKEKKPPPEQGGTRKPNIVKKGMPDKSNPKFKETTEKEVTNIVEKAMKNVSLPPVPIEIRIKSDPLKVETESAKAKVDVDVHVKTPEADDKVVEEKIKTEKAKQKTEEQKQKTEEEKQDAAQKIKKKIEG